MSSVKQKSPKTVSFKYSYRYIWVLRGEQTSKKLVKRMKRKYRLFGAKEYTHSHMMPETRREERTTNIIQSNMKNTLVTQAQILGPPSSAPSVRRLITNTIIQPTEVEKNTSREKLSPPAFCIRNGSLYAMKLYAVSISHGMPMPT